jgi:ABC-type amino acid transport substrate-binding protein
MFLRQLPCMAILVLSLILCGRPLDAAQSESELRVGISPFTPFVILDGEKPTGVSIDIWRILAGETGIRYDFIVCKGVGDKLQRLKDGGIDIAIGGITITEAREKFLDFTHPVYHTGLDILIPISNRPTLIALISSLFTGHKTIFFGGLLVLIIIAGHIIWIVERSSKQRATSFHRNYFPGVFEGMYWALITASTIGYGDKVPKRWIGRILTAVIIITFLPLFGYFIAQLSSDLTMQNLKININGPQDLRGRTVGVVRGTTSQDYMQKEPAYVDAFDSVEDAFEALLKGSVDAVVYDAPNLLYYANDKGKGKVSVVGKLFEPQDYGIALPEGSPLRERINRALLRMVESDELENVKKKWFGIESGN